MNAGALPLHETGRGLNGTTVAEGVVPFGKALSDFGLAIGLGGVFNVGQKFV